MRWILWMLVLTVLLAGGSAQAQMRRGRGPAPDVLERLERMSPDERQRFLDRLPPGRRAHIEERLRWYETLSPEERRRLRQGFRRFRQMPPERQEEARTLFRRFQTFPEPRRRMMRMEVFRLRQMEGERRDRRMNSPEFRERFFPREREMIRDLLELVVPTL
jgi:hypothetical protein